MAGILLSSTISLLSPLSFKPKLFIPSLLPHKRQIQTLPMRTQCSAVAAKKQHDYKLKLVAVNKNFTEPPKMYILSTEEEEDDIITISSGHGFGFPVASCHELLLTKVGYNVLAIWNPSSKDEDEVIKTFPQSYVPRPHFVVGEVDHFYGFGFDPRQENDYKVVRFVSFDYVDGRDSYMEDWVVDIYSSTTRSWKTIPYPHSPNTLSIRSSSITINGFVYWPASYGRGLFVVVPFDFANDTFPSAFIPGPTFASDRDDCFSFRLVEVEGSLGVIKYFGPDDKTIEFEVWVWSNKNHNNNNDGSWSRRGEWVIRIPGETDETRTNSCFLLGLFKNDQLYFEDSDGELWVFDCAKQKLKNLGVYANEYVLSLFPYVERSTN